MKQSIQNVKMIVFYFQKIENFLSIKLKDTPMSWNQVEEKKEHFTLEEGGSSSDEEDKNSGGQLTDRKLVQKYAEVNWTSTAAGSSISQDLENPFEEEDDDSPEESDSENNRYLFKDFSEPEL